MLSMHLATLEEVTRGYTFISSASSIKMETACFGDKKKVRFGFGNIPVP
jgi:hypothetical protein